jgi:hypothetical protein
MILVFFAEIYILAAAAYALVRQPLYATVIAMAVFFFGVVLVPMTEGLWRPHNINSDNLVLLVSFTITLAATLLAWQAVVRDWGWKQHR